MFARYVNWKLGQEMGHKISILILQQCGMQLTDEPEKRCYPLGDHLLCRNCHIVKAQNLGYFVKKEVIKEPKIVCNQAVLRQKFL